MIQIPNEINYIELYFTLRCNLGCSYCINKYDDIKRIRNEKKSIDISNAINNIDFNGKTLTIGGGEPTLREDFYDFVNSLKPEIKIDMLSNLQFDTNVFCKKINPKRFTVGTNAAYKAIRVSYHPSQMNPEILVNKAKILQDNGFSIGIFGIAHPMSIGDNLLMAETCRKSGIYFFVKEFLGEFEGKMFGHYKYPEAVSGIEKKVQCRSSELLIDPSGNIYKCHSDLYSESNAIGNIIDNSNIEFKYRTCDYFGKCNPCDIKYKVDRFLKKGRCSVEIE